MPSLARITRIVDIAFLAALLVAASIASTFIAISPIAFQRASAIVVAEDPIVDWETTSPTLDVARVIGSIPYSSTEAVFEVLPSRIYELTMLRGLGNCANKTRGMTYFLDRAGIPFQRIDFMSVDGFLLGRGHTLIRTKYEHLGDVRVGLVDVLEGSLLMLDGQPIDLAELRAAKPFTIGFLPLNRRCDGQSDYYGTFLDNSVIAVTDPRDTRRYFDFIEAVYVPIGSARFSRILFNGLAVFAGTFPRQRVSQAGYERLFGQQMYVVHAATALRWSGRVCALLLPVVVTLHGLRRWQRRRGAGSGGADGQSGGSAELAPLAAAAAEPAQLSRAARSLDLESSPRPAPSHSALSESAPLGPGQPSTTMR
jgi:hypothetical protein